MKRRHIMLRQIGYRAESDRIGMQTRQTHRLLATVQASAATRIRIPRAARTSTAFLFLITMVSVRGGIATPPADSRPIQQPAGPAAKLVGTIKGIQGSTI